MFNEISILFSGMTTVALIFLIIGLLLLFIEELFFGTWIFGISGFILTIIGIVLRVRVGDGSAIAQVVLLLVMQAILAAIGFLIVYWLSKKGWINHSWLVQGETAVGKDFSAGTADYGHLVGAEGIVFSYLRPIGKAEINGKLYDVNAGSVFIEEGAKIKVSVVEGVRISVVRIKEQN